MMLAVVADSGDIRAMLIRLLMLIRCHAAYLPPLTRDDADVI